MRPDHSFCFHRYFDPSYLVFTEVFVLNPPSIRFSQRHRCNFGILPLRVEAFRLFKLGYGAAIGVVMTPIIVVLSIIQLKLW